MLTATSYPAEVCRLCLIKDQNLLSVFDLNQNTSHGNITGKIYNLFKVEIKREDTISQKICEKCINRVEEFDEFWNIVTNNQQKHEKLGLNEKESTVEHLMRIKEEPITEEYLEENLINSDKIKHLKNSSKVPITDQPLETDYIEIDQEKLGHNIKVEPFIKEEIFDDEPQIEEIIIDSDDENADSNITSSKNVNLHPQIQQALHTNKLYLLLKTVNPNNKVNSDSKTLAVPIINALNKDQLVNGITFNKGSGPTVPEYSTNLFTELPGQKLVSAKPEHSRTIIINKKGGKVVPPLVPVLSRTLLNSPIGQKVVPILPKHSRNVLINKHQGRILPPLIEVDPKTSKSIELAKKGYSKSIRINKKDGQTIPPLVPVVAKNKGKKSVQRMAPKLAERSRTIMINKPVRQVPPLVLSRTVTNKPIGQKIVESVFDNSRTEEEVKSIRPTIDEQPKGYYKVKYGVGFNRKKFPFRCDFSGCWNAYTRKKTLEMHKKYAHTFTCKLCNQVFRTSLEFEEHSHDANSEISQNNFRNYKCNLCKYSTFNKVLSELHKLSHKNVDVEYTSDNEQSHEKFKCNLCGTQFKNKTFLATHLRKHNRKKPYKCLVCGERFTSASLLKYHKISHRVNYECSICNKLYTQKKRLQTHIRKFHWQNNIFGTNMDENYFNDEELPTILEPETIIKEE